MFFLGLLLDMVRYLQMWDSLGGSVVTRLRSAPLSPGRRTPVTRRRTTASAAKGSFP